ncbi:MAG: sigma 54-interacting transcriptional regulator [Pseudomonadota bacterium]|nr:MAG: sigma-54-dependent Fis family transcriptional regulator [Pseudomonadota bacterium]
MGRLVFFRRGEELMRVSLDRPVIVLGRGASADVTIPHRAVSRRQAAIHRGPDGFRLVDLSGRGTRVGDRVVEEAELREGDRIELGDFVACLVLERAEEVEETRVGLSGTRELRTSLGAADSLVLRVRSGERQAVLPLRGTHVVGTEPTCSIVLDDPYASGRHCRISCEGGRVLLVDLGSTNGTWVNGVRVGQAELSAGAWVRVGQSDLVLEREKDDQLSSFEGILSRSPAMREIFQRIERIAPSVAPVAIFGETGTGKELVARAIHRRSDRAKGPFIPVNCAAISRELVESELFGHEKGAFTGAVAARKGAFEEASGGTLFLDEIGELPLELQAKFLRTLESGEIRRVGSSRPFRVDVRVVAATHRDLRAMVRQGSFREDLYYRLTVIRIDLPPLRARKEDIALLAEHLLGLYAPKGPLPSFTNDALVRLTSHDWPGNVRELRNVLARALLLRKGPEITAEDIFFDSEEREEVTPVKTSADDVIYLPGRTLAEIEREAILKCLRRHRGNRRAAARELGLARSTLQLRAKELGVPPPSEYDADEGD